MTDAQKRQYVYDLYSGHKWKKQVERMPDDQVVAIYLKHQQDGEPPEVYSEEEEPDQTEAPDPLEKPEALADFPQNGRGPHWNEDDFQTY